MNLTRIRLGRGQKTEFYFRGVMQRSLLLRPERRNDL